MRKRIIAGLLAAVMVMLSGCSGKSGDGTTKRSEAGGYIQEYITMPGEVSYSYAIASLADGTLRVVASNGVYDSADGGVTWEAYDYGSALLSELLSEEEEFDEEYYSYMYPDCVSIHKDGTLFIAIDKWEYMADDYSNEVINVVITPEGTERRLDIELPEIADDYYDGMTEETVISAAEEEDDEAAAEEEEYFEYERALSAAVFAGDDKIVGTSNGTDEVFVIDLNSGEIMYTLKAADDYIETFTVYNNQIIVRTWESLEVFDLETGELTAGMPALEAFFNDNRYSNFTFMPDEENKAIYAFDSENGIYKFSEDASEPELLVSASNNAMANPDIYFERFVLLADESFLAMVDKDGSSGELICFSYTDEIPEPELSLTIYSLTEQYSLKRSVANFQELYPQYELNYVYGLDDWESGLSLSEVLKNLNTEILGGNGPDIIMMDGISMDSFVEKGVLADLSDIIAASEGEFFDNVLNTYAADEGTYAVPTKFVVPVLLGKEDDLAQITDVSTLADFVAATRSADSKDELRYVMGSLWDSELSSFMLQIAGSDMIKDDGTVDEAKLKQYVADVKKIYDNNELVNSKSPAQEDDELEGLDLDEDDSDFYYQYDYYISIINQGAAYLESGENLMLTGNIMSMDSVLELFTIQDKFDLKAQTMEVGEGTSYMAMNSFAINAQSEQPEAAAEFLTYLLSTAAQASNEWDTGIPVNIDAYDAIYQKKLEEAVGEDGEIYSEFGYGFELEDGTEYDIMFSMEGVTADDYEQVKALLQTVDTPSVNNNVIVTTILRQMLQCLNGEATEAEVVENILTDINLYLAE